MTKQEMGARLIDLTNRHKALMMDLMIPARAAHRALLDAGMKNTADPLGESLFQIDALTQELNDVINEDKEQFSEIIVSAIMRAQGRK